MRCRQAEDYVGQELDGVLAPEITGELREHLDLCGKCQEYRNDLLLGQRLLAATEPELPENFDWRLQLKLNQLLQETVGEHHYPWHEQGHDRLGWWRNFSAATAVGMAAVLALAMLVGPFGLTVTGQHGPQVASENGSNTLAANDSQDRRPLVQPRSAGLSGFGVQHVSSARSRKAERWNVSNHPGVWSQGEPEDQLTIWRLRIENQRLQQVLLESQRRNALMCARLDTAGTHALHLQHDR